MSASAFAITLTVGAALLALWLLIRYADFGPRTLVRAVGHTIIACLMLALLLPVAFDAIGTSGLPGVPYVQVFGVALPLLVYAFLAGGWTTRAAIDFLR
jgi:hypothetical protein